MPVDNWVVVFPRASSDPFVRLSVFLFFHGGEGFILFLFGMYGNIDMADFKIYGRDEINSGDFGDNRERLWVFPNVVNKRRAPVEEADG